MQLSNLLLFLVYGLDLLLGLLGQLFELLFHSADFVGCLAIFIVLQGFLLCFPDLFKRVFFFLKGFELSLKVFQLIFLFDDLIDIVFAVEIPP